MGQFTVKSPDGAEYDVNTPDGATQADAVQYVKREVAAGRLRPSMKQMTRGVAEQAVEPFTRIPGDVAASSRRGMDDIAEDWHEMTKPDQSLSGLVRGDKPTTLGRRALYGGKLALDTFNLPWTPVEGAMRSIVGRPIENVTGLPEAYGTGAATAAATFFGPGVIRKIVGRAIKTGKIGEKEAPAFAETLKQRVAKEGVTGLPKGKVDDLTPEQIDKLVEAMGRTPLGHPGKPVQTAEQKAGARIKESVTPEQITGVKGADDISMVGRPEPQMGAPGEAQNALPATEFPKATYPELPDPLQEPKPAGMKPRPPMRKGVKLDYNNDTLLTAIKKLGGLNVAHVLDISGEKGFRASAGKAGLWKKDGKSIDDMVLQLADEGYIPAEALHDVDGGVQWLRDAVRGEMDGHKVYSARGDEDVIFGRMRDSQGGKIDAVLATKIGTTAAGALIGAGLDPENPTHGAILGAAGGFGLGHIVSRRVITGGFGSALREAKNPGAALHDAKEAEVAAGQRQAAQTYSTLRSYNLPPERGFAVIRAIETGDVSALSPQEKSVAQLFSNEVGKLGMAAQEAGVIQNLKRNYAPLVFDWSDPHTASILRKMGATDPAKGERTAGFSTFTPFQLERTIDDYGMAQRLGLKPKTTDPAELFRLYASSVVRATENKRAITELANLKDATGKPLVGLKGDKGVGGDWVPINKGDVKVPELDGFMVDPDIAASVRAGLTSYDPSIIARSAMNVSWFAKRFNVSMSAFHPMALLQAHAGAGGNPFDVLAGAAARGVEKVTGKIIPYESAVDGALQAYRQGGKNDAVDVLIRNGLKIEAPIEDRSGRDAFQATMKWIGDKGDSLVPGGGLLPKGAAAVDSGLQKFTWDYMYTGMKLSTGMKMLEQEVQRNMTAAAAGKEALRPVNQIAADVSSFVNSTFGGLNLRRIAEDVNTQWGGKAGSAAYALASPRGQAYAQIAAFAPDWKISTLQAWTRGLGLTGNETVQRFHREYLVRSAMMSMVLADAVNYKMSGHHVWQNNFHNQRGHKQTTLEQVHDATYVDLGDGRKMQMFKHLMEGPHAVTDPQKFALNALGYLPSTVAQIATNKEFLTPDWSPNIVSGNKSWMEKIYQYGAHALKRALPIAGHSFDQGVGPGVGSVLGTPIYGHTAQQKAQMNQQRLEERAKEMEGR